MIRRFTIGSLLPFFASSLIANAQTPASNYTLTILHNNDVHARVDQVTMGGSNCTLKDAEAQKCFGGYARIASFINQIRQQKANQAVIVLNAGDSFQGSLFYTYYKSAALWPFINYIQYDAITLGNHEFDNGVPELVEFLKNSENLKLVVANINTDKEPSLKPYISRSTVITKQGEKIGVIGLITEETAILASPGPNVAFENLRNSLEREVKILQSQGVNKIIALTHIGLAEDVKLAAAVEGVDVYVGGHSHTLLSNTSKNASSPYPIVVKRPSGDPALVVQAYYAGIYVGDLEVTFNEKGVPISWKGDNVLLDSKIPQDQQLVAMVAKLAEPLQIFRQKEVGATSVELVGNRDVCRYEECNLGSLISDALLYATKKQKTQIAFQNGGGIRTSIPQGKINLGQILEVLPFSNNISVFGLKGSDIRLALENGVSRAENNTNEGTGRFLQVSGLRYSWDPKKPVGSRILDVQVRQTDGTFIPLQNNIVYQVTTNDFVRMGGDGFSVFKENAINPSDNGMNLEDALVEYIQFLSTDSPAIAPKTEGRINRQ